MVAESGENLNCSPLQRRLLYHPVHQKFARNRSISYGFRDIDTFSFSAKIQDGLQVAKIEIFSFWTGHSCTTLLVKNSLEIALSLTVFKILTLFHFPQKSKMAAESGENLNFPPLHRTLLYHPAGQKFAQNRSICYGFQDIETFPFSAKIQDGRRKWRKFKFSPLHRTLLYHPAGQKFARNRSIPYGFRDIDTFPFSAKIQDGRQKWRKFKFSPFA